MDNFNYVGASSDLVGGTHPHTYISALTDEGHWFLRLEQLGWLTNWLVVFTNTWEEHLPQVHAVYGCTQHKSLQWHHWHQKLSETCWYWKNLVLYCMMSLIGVGHFFLFKQTSISTHYGVRLTFATCWHVRSVVDSLSSIDWLTNCSDPTDLCAALSWHCFPSLRVCCVKLRNAPGSDIGTLKCKCIVTHTIKDLFCVF